MCMKRLAPPMNFKSEDRIEQDVLQIYFQQRLSSCAEKTPCFEICWETSACFFTQDGIASYDLPAVLSVCRDLPNKTG